MGYCKDCDTYWDENEGEEEEHVCAECGIVISKLTCELHGGICADCEWLLAH